MKAGNAATSSLDETVGGVKGEFLSNDGGARHRHGRLEATSPDASFVPPGTPPTKAPMHAA
jgi:hypothetical protein